MLTLSYMPVMKLYFKYLFPLMIAGFLLYSCSDSDPEPKKEPQIDMNKTASGLELRPFLRLNVTSHSDSIMRMSVDAQQTMVATASLDKTIKLWSLPGLQLLKTLYAPIGTGNDGKFYSAAVSPNGKQVAGGGWLMSGSTDQLYVHIFDAATGKIVRSISNLDDIVTHLCYSPDGRYLAGVLNNANGLRVWDVRRNYQQIAEDRDYKDSSYFCEFDSQGRSMVTSSYDGFIRIYNIPDFGLSIKGTAPGGRKPFFTPFSPDAKLIAVGFTDSPQLNVLSAGSLKHLYTPAPVVSTGDLGRPAWSHDSFFLFAGGLYKNAGGNYPVRIWREQGLGKYTEISASFDTIMGIIPLKDRKFLVTSQDPTLYLIGDRATILNKISPEIVDFNLALNKLSVSDNGHEISYYYMSSGQIYRAYFNAYEQRLQGLPPQSALLNLPRESTAQIKTEAGEEPNIFRVNGTPIALAKNDSVHVFSVAENNSLLLTGSEFGIRIYTPAGVERLKINTPAAVYQLNQSKDLKWIIAGLSDGSIRWYNMQTGEEVLLYVMRPNGNDWVLYTPSGYYTTSPGATNLIYWQKNMSESESVSQNEETYRAAFYQPETLKKIFGN
ncbi:hypothetical protein CHS0354_035350 [Potamilus streckersoni]|uniref:Uncharacterized protein n=1 Tax=Potamilus streckersoni TaxID=2493646 RepID=A0AAE0S364_9BIVA|nr:hypothetical protein CHS0354_035350 [Potamilus streckersoni]